MKKSYKQIEKAERFIVILLLIIFLLLMSLSYKIAEADRANHLTRCTKECYPRLVDEEASRFNCYCKEKEE